MEHVLDHIEADVAPLAVPWACGVWIMCVEQLFLGWDGVEGPTEDRAVLPDRAISLINAIRLCNKLY